MSFSTMTILSIYRLTGALCLLLVISQLTFAVPLPPPPTPSPSSSSRPTQIKEVVPNLEKQHLVQSLSEDLAPVKTTSITSTTTSASTATSSLLEEKAKRSVNEYAQFDVGTDDDEDASGESNEVTPYDLPYFAFQPAVANSRENEDDDGSESNVLHLQTKEKPAQVHDKTDKVAGEDNSHIYTDVVMSPNELTNIVRRRRSSIADSDNLMGRRRKRELSSYDLYNDDSVYEPSYADLLESERYQRLNRAYSPLYWHPAIYERSIRSALAYPYYQQQSPYLYNSYNGNNDRDDTDEDEQEDSGEQGYDVLNDEIDSGITNNDEDEINRYPILLKSYSPYDNFDRHPYLNIDDMTEQRDDDDDQQEEDETDNELPPYIQPSYHRRFRPTDSYF